MENILLTIASFIAAIALVYLPLWVAIHFKCDWILLLLWPFIVAGAFGLLAAIIGIFSAVKGVRDFQKERRANP